METKEGGRRRHALRVARTEPVADGVQLFELRAENSEPLPPFSPGAHLNVRAPNGSYRNYSICNDASEGDRYVIAVKREIGGRGGSISLIDNTRRGDMIDVGVPDNLFHLDLSAPRRHRDHANPVHDPFPESDLRQAFRTLLSDSLRSHDAVPG